MPASKRLYSYAILLPLAFLYGCGVDSLLTVKDANTGEVKFKANADSDISMGGAGGDMGKILEQNIRKLIAQYQTSLAGQ